MFALFRHS